MGGKVYQLTTVKDENNNDVERFAALYTHPFFNDTAGDMSDAYVEHVTSGVFAGPDPTKSGSEMINEQFVFTVAAQDGVFGGHDYYYKVGFISMSANTGSGTTQSSAGITGSIDTFHDNAANMNTYLVANRDGGVESDYGTAMVPVVADVDNDGILVKYVGTDYYYEDPTVEAVLQAAPYFDELGGWTDEFSGSTSYSASISRSLIDIWGHSISVHAGVKGKWGSDLTGELEIKIGYALDVDKQHELTYTDTYTTTFMAGPYDTVVMQRTPYVCYEYARVDENGNVLKETDDNSGSVVFMEAMHPVYFQLSVEEYNRFVDEYNAIAARHDEEGKKANGDAVETVGDSYRLVKITEDILPANTTGNPENYASAIRDGQYISQGTYALGYNGGSTESEFAKGIEKSFTQVNAHGAHIEAEGVTPGLGFNIGGFAETAFQDTAGWGDATLNENATGGEVANINPANYIDQGIDLNTLKMYGFNWRCALWKKCLMTKADGTPFLDADGNAILVPIVGYVVTNVKNPGSAPSDVEAYLSGRGNQVTVEWTPISGDGKLKGYSIYRSCDNQAPVLVNTTRIAPDATSFVDTTKLKPGKIYTYSIVAHYLSGNIEYKTMNSKTSTVVWGIPLFWLNEEEGGDGDNGSGG